MLVQSMECGICRQSVALVSAIHCRGRLDTRERRYHRSWEENDGGQHRKNRTYAAKALETAAHRPEQSSLDRGIVQHGQCLYITRAICRGWRPEENSEIPPKGKFVVACCRRSRSESRLRRRCRHEPILAD